MKGIAATGIGALLTTFGIPLSPVPVGAASETAPLTPESLPGDVIMAPGEESPTIKKILRPTGVETAEVQAPLDEPVSTLITTSEGVDEEGDAYRQYMIEYHDETFTVKAKTIPSDRYNQLNWFYNPGDDAAQFVTRPITLLTYETGDQDAQGLHSVTTYCAQSDVDPLTALVPDFYENGVLKESWTALQFAQAFNPSYMHSINANVSLHSFNQLAEQSGGRTIHNASVIISNKKTPGNLNMPIENTNLPSDDGASMNTGNRLPTEYAMYGMAGTFTHELRHTTEVLPTSTYYRLFDPPARDNIRESVAQMSRAGFLQDTGNAPLPYFLLYQSRGTFLPTNGCFEFKPYSPGLVAMMLEPHSQDIARYFNEDTDWYDQEEAITTEGLTQLHKRYMQLRDEFFMDIGLDWYSAWPSFQFPIWEDRLHKPATFNQVDLWAPLVFARHVNQNQPITDKVAFMQEVMDTIKNEALSTRARALEEAMSGTQKNLRPYLKDMIDELVLEDRVSINSGGRFYTAYPSIVQPAAVGDHVAFTRPRDIAYQSSEVSGSAPEDIDYRRFYPMYHLGAIEPATEGTQLQIQQQVDNEDFLVALLYIDSDTVPTDMITAEDRRNLKPKRIVLEKGKPILLPSGRRVIVGTVDKRTDQIDDDISGWQQEVFHLRVSPLGQPLVAESPPPARPEPTPSPSPTPPPSPTPEAPTNTYLPSLTVSK